MTIRRRPAPSRRVKRVLYPCNAPSCERQTPDWTFFCDEDWARLPLDLKNALIARTVGRDEAGEPTKQAVKAVAAAVAHLSQVIEP